MREEPEAGAAEGLRRSAWVRESQPVAAEAAERKPRERVQSAWGPAAEEEQAQRLWARAVGESWEQEPGA